MKIGTNKQKFKWFISYVSLVVVCMMIGYGLYYASTNTLKKQINETLNFAVSNTRDFCTSEIEKKKILMYTLMQNTYVEAFANKYRTYKWETESESVKMIMSFIATGISNSDFANNIMLIFDHYDVVINSNGKSRKSETFNRYFQDYYLNEQQWLDEIFSINNMFVFKRFVDDNGKANIVMVQKSIKNIGGRPPVVAIAFLNEKKLFNIYESSDKSVPLKAYILTMEDEVIFRSDDDDISSLEIKNNQNVKLNGENYIMSISQNDEFKYVQLFKTEEHTNRMQLLSILGLVCNIFCLLVGIVIAAYFTKTNYIPIRGILSKFGQNLEYENENEYSLIEREIESMLKKCNDIQKMLNEKNRWLQEVFWEDLFNATSKRQVRTIIEKYNINLDKKVVVIMFDVEDYGVLKTIKKDKDKSMCNFAISNVYSELMKNVAENKYFLVEGIYYCVLTFDKASIMSSVYDNALTLTEFLKEKFNLYISCFISNIGKLEDFNELHEQVITANEFGKIMPNKKVWAYTDVELCSLEKYVTNSEEDLINAIKSGNEQEVTAKVSEIFKHHFSMFSVSNSSKDIIMQCIVNTLSNLSLSTECNSEYNLEASVKAAYSIKNIEKRVKKHALVLTKHFAKGKEKDCETILNTIKLIEENYSNYDLNVSYISDKIGISVNHLSRHFKAKMGEGLANYILNYRCAKAEEYIRDGVHSIAKISQMCGFENVSSFIRAFKRIYNVTPGRYLSECMELHQENILDDN